MNTSQTDLELIERFISGKLSRTELEDFETRMEDDHEFARKLRLRKTFPSLFKAEGHDEIVMTPDSVPAEKPKKEKAHSSRTRYFVGGGIVLFVALAMAVVYFLIIRTGSADQEMAAEKSVVKPAVKTPAPTPAAVQMQTQAKPEVPAGNQAAAPQNNQAAATQNNQAVATQNNPGVTPQNSPAAAPKQPTPEKPAPPKPEANVHQAIMLLSPADNLSVKRGDEVLFSWKQSTDSFTNFYIFSESNNKLAWWRGIRPGIREIKVPAMNFKPGRFYWYVGTRDNRRIIIIKE